jgi:AraC-like DNA-binding protein
MPRARQLGAIPSCAGVMTRVACARARDAGINLAPVLWRVGLTVDDIDNDSAPLRVATQIKCLNVLAEATNDRLLGYHLGRSMDLRRGGLLYYAAASSEVLGDALARIARYSAMVNEGIKLHIEVRDTLRIGFTYAGVPRRSDRHQIEAWTTLIVRYCRELTGRGLQALEVRWMHHRIAESDELDSFFGCRAEFSAERDDVSFSAEAAKLPVANADRFLNKLLVGYCETVLARRKARPGVTQADVENTLAGLLPHGHITIENVAERLSVSPRTLRRKLAAEGVTFAGILEDLRFALARRYLSERDLSISRIAWLLGYTEVSAFSHAFRRWSGHAPRLVRSRRQHAAVPHAKRLARS